MSDLQFASTGDPDVDRVFTSLKVQMQSWEPRTLGGISVEDLAAIVSTQFYQTFQDSVTPGWIYRHTGSPTFTYPSNGSAGGKALRVDGDEAILEVPYSLPLNPDTLYRLRVRARVITAPSTTSYAHFGVQMLDSGGSYLDSAGGSNPLLFHRYVADSWDLSAASPGTWITFEGYVKGVGATAAGPSTLPSAPRLWHTNAVSFRPIIHVMDGATDGIVEIDYVSVQTITETPEIDDLLQTVDGLDKTVVSGTINPDGTISDGNVPTGAIQDGAVTGIKVGNRVISTTHIALGGVTTDELGDLAATKAKIGALAIDVTKIEDDAISTPKLQALSITGAKIEAGAVTADKITVSQLSAIAANMGVLTAGKIEVGSMSIDAATERILFGAATAPLVGTGVFLGKDGVDYEFRVGNPAGSYIHWNGASLYIGADGSNLTNIDGSAIQTGTIGSDPLASGAVIAGKIAANAVIAGTIAAGTIVTGDIAANTIVAGNIASGTITSAEIAANTIVAGNIFAGTITGTEIAALTITSGLIAAGAVIAGKIAADAVTANEINVGELSAIAANMGTLTSGEIRLGAATSPIAGVGIWIGQDGADWEFRAGDPAGNRVHWDGSTLTIVGSGANLTNLDGSQLAAGSVDTAQIAADAITQALIAAGSVDTTELANLAVTGGKIAAGTITAGNIQALTITGALIAANTIAAGKLVANTITANEIAAGTITADEIATGTITATQITGTTLSAIYADMGTITAGKIDVGSIEINADTERILFGAATAPLTGTGIFLGKDGTDYEFRVGNPAGDHIHWDGSTLSVGGTITASEFTAETPTFISMFLEGKQLLSSVPRIRFDHRYHVSNHMFEFVMGSAGNDMLFTATYNGTSTDVAYINSDTFEIKRALKHTGTTFGLFSTTPQTQYTDYGALTDNTGGSGTTLESFTGGTLDDQTVDDNFAVVNNKLNSIRVVLRRYGMMT